MSKIKQTSFDESAILNNRTYGAWFKRLYAAAITRFEWENLPETVDERYLEMTLFWNGVATIFNDKYSGEWYGLPVLSSGSLDIYGYPRRRTAYAFNGYNYPNLTNKNSVLIYNNATRTPDKDIIELYARRLYEIERTMDTNIKLQKTSGLFICDENQRLTYQNIFQKYDGNEPLIMTTKQFDPNTIKWIGTDAKFVAMDLQTLKKQYFQEAFTYLGIEGNISEKSERVVTGEISANLGITEASRLNGLMAREMACEQFNQRFNPAKPLGVKFRSDLMLTQIEEENIFVNGQPKEMYDPNFRLQKEEETEDE